MCWRLGLGGVLVRANASVSALRRQSTAHEGVRPMSTLQLVVPVVPAPAVHVHNLLLVLRFYRFSALGIRFLAVFFLIVFCTCTRSGGQVGAECNRSQAQALETLARRQLALSEQCQRCVSRRACASFTATRAGTNSSPWHTVQPARPRWDRRRTCAEQASRVAIDVDVKWQFHAADMHAHAHAHAGSHRATS